jgi:hypothetical protein
MIPSLSQEVMTQYASDAQTIQEPQGTDFSQGVRVGKTVPAKWWNWLFSNVTKRVVQSRSDANDMLAELKNVVTDAGITPSASDNTQLKQAIATKTDAQINKYVDTKKGYFITWKSVPFPDITLPSGYTWHPKYFKEPNICVRYAYQSADPSLTGNFYFEFNIDGLHWIASDVIHMQSSVYASRMFTCFISRLGNKWFLLIGGLTNVGYQNATFHELFESDDLVHWTSVRTISQSYSVAAVTVRPYMFVAYDTLYVMTSEGTQQSTNYYIYSTNNGYSWNTQTSPLNYASVSTGPTEMPWLLGNGKFILGNIYYDGAVFSTLFGTRAYANSRHFQFGDGSVIYEGDASNTVYKAAYPGAVAQSETLSDYIYMDDMQSFNGDAILKAGDRSSLSNRRYVRLSSNLTMTDISVPAGYNCAVEILIEHGTAYCARYKSADLVTWVELDNAPPDISSSKRLTLIRTADSGILGFGVAYLESAELYYITKNFGLTWFEVSPSTAHLGSMIVDNVCFDLSGYSTANGVNRVSGYTLYLR